MGSVPAAVENSCQPLVSEASLHICRSTQCWHLAVGATPQLASGPRRWQHEAASSCRHPARGVPAVESEPENDRDHGMLPHVQTFTPFSYVHHANKNRLALSMRSSIRFTGSRQPCKRRIQHRETYDL